MVEELQVCISQLVDAFHKKVGIFEIAEQTQVQHQATGEVELFLRNGMTGGNEPSPVIIADNGEDKQDEEHTARFVIKEKTHQQKVDRPCFILPVDQRINSQYHRKKSPEIQLSKDHRLAFRIKQVRF